VGTALPVIYLDVDSLVKAVHLVEKFQQYSLYLTIGCTVTQRSKVTINVDQL